MLALIMAGGLGTRFWPKSRRKHPKHLLSIQGNNTLIQNTIQRLQPLVEPTETYVVSTADQLPQLQKQLPQLPEQNYIVEPRGKNTAPAIGLAALFMAEVDPEAVMVVMPSDHLIENEELFLKTLEVGSKYASELDKLVTIGIKPTYPATGYGYIQFDQELSKIDDIGILHVKTFAEKPNQETAELFLKSGDFLWNSGIFIWKVRTILKEIEENLPQLYDGLMEIREAMGQPNIDEVIERVYCQIRSISIDYGVMEHANDVAVLRGEFVWNDLGSWEEVYKINEKDKQQNVVRAQDALLKDISGCLIDAPEKCVAMVGVSDLVVVDTGEVLLICPRARAQDVKMLVETAQKRKLKQYL